MKISTIMGVLAAAAAVVAIAIAAPSRAFEPRTPGVGGAATPCAAECTPAAGQTRAARPSGPPAWVLVVAGLAGLSVMFRAARPAFRE